jgi:hypothetical protein
MPTSEDFCDLVRENIIGRQAAIRTPFGERRVTYADHTAWARGALHRGYLSDSGALQTPTGDATGYITSRRCDRRDDQACWGRDCWIIEDGAGHGAVRTLQQILGILPPPARTCASWVNVGLRRAGTRARGFLLANRPVVFVGPCEHHSSRSPGGGFAEVMKSAWAEGSWTY